VPASSADKVLAYWDRMACSFDAIYTGEKPKWSRYLDLLLRRDMYQRFDWILRNSGDLKGRSVCDLGCGTGRYLIAYARSGAQRVLGIDGANGMVSRASSLIQQVQLQERVEVREGNILGCGEDEIFDICIAVGVFDYTRDPLPFLKQINMITKSRFLATFPRLWTYRAPLRKVRLGLQGCPVHFYTADQVKSLLAASGFVCRVLERVGALYCVAACPETPDTRAR
jgi:SAM-dependent methyltransferase